MACFRFKRFSIEQEHSAMKVNTDGVLLGAWMNILPEDRKLLDIGTGSGVIALMAAQRILEQGMEPAVDIGAGSCYEILGIDIDADSLKDAEENFKNFSESFSCAQNNLRIDSLLSPVQELPLRLKGEKFNLLFSNPPYFINSLKSADGAKSNARHTDMLSQGDMIRSALKLLAPYGRLAIILPSVEAEEFVRKVEFIASAGKREDYVLQLCRVCKVHTTKSKPAKRWMMEFVLSNTDVAGVEESQLIIQSNGEYTTGYKSITGSFYLSF